MATTDTAMFCRFCGEELFERPDGTLDTVYRVCCDTTKCTVRCDACLCLPHELAPDEGDVTELMARLEADATRALGWLWAHTDQWLNEPSAANGPGAAKPEETT